MVVAVAELAQPGQLCLDDLQSNLKLCGLKRGGTRRDALLECLSFMQVYNLTIRQFGALQSIAPNMHQMGYRCDRRLVLATQSVGGAITCVHGQAVDLRNPTTSSVLVVDFASDMLATLCSQGQGMEC